MGQHRELECDAVSISTAAILSAATFPGTGSLWISVLARALSSFATLAERGLTARRNRSTSAHSIRELLVKDHPYIGRTLTYLAVTLARLGDSARNGAVRPRFAHLGGRRRVGSRRLRYSLMIGAFDLENVGIDWATARRGHSSGRSKSAWRCLVRITRRLPKRDRPRYDLGGPRGYGGAAARAMSGSGRPHPSGADP